MHKSSIPFRLVILALMMILVACSPLSAQADQNTPTSPTATPGNIEPTVVTAQPSTSVPPTSPVGGPYGGASNTITLANNNQLITLHPDETFLLKLGDNYLWDIQIDHPNVVSRVPNIMVVRGAQGVYRAHEAGNATLSASGDPQCRQAKPPCMIPSILFTLHIEVKP